MTDSNIDSLGVKENEATPSENTAVRQITCWEGANAPQAASQETVSMLPSQQNPILSSEAAKISKRYVQKIDRRDITIAALTLLFSAFAYECLWRSNFRSGFTAVSISLLIIATAYLGKNRRKLGAYQMICGFASAAFAALFTIASDDILLLCFAAMIFTGIVYVFSLWGQPRYPLGSYSTVFDVLKYSIFLPISKLPEPFRALANEKGGNIKKAPKVLLGALAVLPVLLVVLPLLISSDAAFEGLMSHIWGDTTEILMRIVFTVLIFIYVFSFLFTMRKGLDKAPENTPTTIPTHKVDGTVVNTALILLSSVYVVYMLSQLSYFFSAFSGFLPDDFTFSGYARRGFFEMCAIAAVNLGVIFLSLVMSKYRGGVLSKLTKALCLCVGIFSMLLTVTSFSKMYMYITEYGLTRLRVITSAFMIVLFLVFVYTIIRIFNTRFQYMKFAVVTACVVLIALTIADVDRCVAKYNIYAYRSGITETLDMDLLYSLGSGSTPELESLLDDDNAEIKMKAAELLYMKANNYFDMSNDMSEYSKTKLWSFNLSEYREKEALRGCLEKIKDYKDNTSLSIRQ